MTLIKTSVLSAISNKSICRTSWISNHRAVAKFGIVETAQFQDDETAIKIAGV